MSMGQDDAVAIVGLRGSLPRLGRPRGLLGEHRRRRRRDQRGPARPLAPRPGPGATTRKVPQARPGLRHPRRIRRRIPARPRRARPRPRAGRIGSTRCSTWPSTRPAGLERRRGPRRSIAAASASSSATSSCPPRSPRRTRARSWAGRSRRALGVLGPAEATDRAAQRLPGRPARGAGGPGTRARGRGVHARRGLCLVALRAQAGRRRAPLGPGRRDDHRRASRAPTRSTPRWASPSSGPSRPAAGPRRSTSTATA